MSELPSGWVKVPLGDVGDLHCGQSPSVPTVNQNGIGTPYVTGPEQWDGKAFRNPKWTTDPRRIVPDGCVFITVKGAGVGKTFPGVACAIGRDVYAFEPSPEMDYQFALRTISYRATEIIEEARGDIPGLSKSHIADYVAGIPPLPEQKRIVRKLDTLSARTTTARTHLTAIAKLAEKYKRGVYNFHFSNAGERVALGTIAKVGTGATPKKGNPRFYDQGNVPWVTSGAVNAKTVNEPSGYITETALAETNCKLFPAGSLLMAMYGEGKTRGQVARLGIEAATNQALAVIHEIDGERVNVDYLYRFLDSIYLEIRELAEGGVQPNLSLGKVKSFELPLPSLEVQCEIVRQIETAFAKIDRLAAEAEKALKLTDRLDQRILAKAFSGELVPQDPTDEPATELLARIREARAAAPKPKRGRRKKAEA